MVVSDVTSCGSGAVAGVASRRASPVCVPLSIHSGFFLNPPEKNRGVFRGRGWRDVAESLLVTEPSFFDGNKLEPALTPPIETQLEKNLFTLDSRTAFRRSLCTLDPVIVRERNPTWTVPVQSYGA